MEGIQQSYPEEESLLFSELAGFPEDGNGSADEIRLWATRVPEASTTPTR